MPNRPKTPLMALRVDRWVQDALELFSAERGITKSDVVRLAATEALAAEPMPHHSCHHAIYRLTCEDFDLLNQRAGGACEICGTVPVKLQIDHDHAEGAHGVRGLLCPKCNALMRRVDSGERRPDKAVTAYLDNPWFKFRPPRTTQASPRRVRTNRVVRVDDPTWEAAQRAADARDENLSEAIRRFLVRYGREHRKT